MLEQGECARHRYRSYGLPLDLSKPEPTVLSAIIYVVPLQQQDVQLRVYHRGDEVYMAAAWMPRSLSVRKK